jgi:hypothetical protein
VFWSQYTLSDINIMRYGLPKMLQLVKDVKSSMIYASCNPNMLIHLDKLGVRQSEYLKVLKYLVSIGANS